MSAELLEVGIRLLDPRLSGWGFPRWGSAQAAGLDLHACLDAAIVLEPQGPPALIPAGFCVLIRDSDWCGLVFPRSGLGHRDGHPAVPAAPASYTHVTLPAVATV